MDFGLARAIEDSALTQPGTIMGTPFYMSPEQLAGDKVDERTDIYAIGLVLFYCLTGEELFRADSVAAVVSKHMHINIRDVVGSHSRLASNLQDVLVSMIEEDPNMRARSAKEILERLTLRKIVAMGLAATEDPLVSDASTPTEAFPRAVPTREAAASVEDPRLAAAAERRKARLRSLLDTL
jgi:serine/threonine-protein kinase